MPFSFLSSAFIARGRSKYGEEDEEEKEWGQDDDGGGGVSLQRGRQAKEETVDWGEAEG